VEEGDFFNERTIESIHVRKIRTEQSESGFKHCIIDYYADFNVHKNSVFKLVCNGAADFICLSDAFQKHAFSDESKDIEQYKPDQNFTDAITADGFTSVLAEAAFEKVGRW